MRKHLLITGLCCGLAFALLTPAALAQTTGQMTDHQRIEALEARVAALERRLGMAPATPQPVSHHQPSPTAAPTPATSHRQPAATAMAPTATPQPVPHRQPSPTATPTPATSPRQPAATATVPPASSGWSHLHRGMDSRQVIALIGQPEKRQARPMSEIWFYPDDRQVEFDRNSRLQSWSKP
jgi:hypothetical protein